MESARSGEALGNMFPHSTVFDAENCSRRYAISLSQPSSRRSVLSNRNDFNIRKFVFPVIHALRLVVSALVHAIDHVVSISSEKEMIGVHASRRVAVVTHEQSVKDWSMRKRPRESMRWIEGCWLAISNPVVEIPIPSFTDGALPQPARLSFLNLRPELFFLRDTLFSSHAVIASERLGVVRGALGVQASSRLVHHSAEG